MKKEFKRYYTQRETVIKVKHNCLVLHDIVETDFPSNRERHDISKERWTQKGIVSINVRKAIAKTSRVLVNTLIFGKSKRRPVFTTLTFPSEQVHTDQECTKMFTRWIDVMKRQYSIVNYVYRIEKQKNGNCHYHVIIDCYIKRADALRNWCVILERQGYITRYRQNNNKENDELPNCVDIKGIKNAQEAVNYIAKYINKDDNGDELRVNGRIWGCSENLKNIKEPSISITPGIQKELAEFMPFAEKKDYCTIIPIIPSSLTTPLIWAALEKEYQKLYRQWYYTNKQELFIDKIYKVNNIPIELLV